MNLFCHLSAMVPMKFENFVARPHADFGHLLRTNVDQILIINLNLMGKEYFV